MSTKNPTASQFSAYRRQYDYFNRALFAGKLKPVILNFSRQANSLGFFAPERWDDGSMSAHEISLNPTYLKLRDARDSASTLVHEMAHCWQQQCGSPGKRGYHNEEWAAKMDEIGLTPTATGEAGGARTGYKMTHLIVEGGAFARAFERMPEDCKFPWLCAYDLGKGKAKPRPASKVKFSCPKCSANAWGKPSLHLTCGDCEVAMLAEGATDGDDAEQAAA